MPSMKVNKEKLDCLRTIIESMNNSLGLYALSIKGNTFNIIGFVSLGLWFLDSGAMDHMTISYALQFIFQNY